MKGLPQVLVQVRELGLGQELESSHQQLQTNLLVQVMPHNRISCTSCCKSVAQNFLLYQASESHRRWLPFHRCIPEVTIILYIQTHLPSNTENANIAVSSIHSSSSDTADSLTLKL